MTKLWKRVLVSAMASIMMIATIGCGASTEETSNTTKNDTQVQASTNAGELVAEEGAVIKFSYWEGSPSDKEAWDLVLEQFRQDHPEITLQAEVYPSNSYISQLDTMIAGNEWPDVMRYTYQNLGKFKEADVMLDLQGMIPQESLDDLLPAFKNAMMYDGKLVGMPHHTDTMAVFYNKDMFEKSGIRIPENVNDGWSWDELTEIARKVKADHNLDYAFGGMWDNDAAYRYLPFVYMNGGSLLNEDGTQVTVDTPEFLEAVQLYESWRKENLIMPVGMTQEPQCNPSFVAKQIAFVFTGSWNTSYMEENMPGNWGVTYMPQVDGKTGSDMGGNALFAYAGTEYPKAAAIFIDYITQKETMKAFCEAGGFLPVRSSLAEETLAFPEFQEEMQKFVEISATVDPKMAEDETSIRFQSLNLVMASEMDPMIINNSVTAEDTVKNMQTKLQEVLDE